MQRIVLLLMCLCGLLTAARTEIPPTHPIFQRGLASWYGAPFQGRRTASGAVYHEGQLTAAHRTLPLGSEVRVRLRGRRRSVIVRITDRGPFLKSRIIDLSRAAAMRLGIVHKGVAPVTLQVLEVTPNYRRTAKDRRSGAEFAFLRRAPLPVR